jgi:hypothetical protein
MASMLILNKLNNRSLEKSSLIESSFLGFLLNQNHYQMAWCYDNLGEEQLAIPHYIQAISLGLCPSSLEGAYLGPDKII